MAGANEFVIPCEQNVLNAVPAGTEFPDIRVGSFHGAGQVTFAVCHGHNPGIVIDLADSKYDRVVLTVENPEEIAARLSSPPSQ